MHRSRDRRNQRGVVLVAAVCLTVVVLGLGLAALGMATNELVSTRRAADVIVSRNVAEAGTEMALWQLKQDSTWRCTGSPAGFTNAPLTVTVGGQTITLGQFTVSPLIANADSSVKVSSTGAGAGVSSQYGIPKTISVIAYPTNAPSLFAAGLVGKDGITMTGSGGTDSYDSSVGAYGGSNVRNHGDMRTDATGNGKVSIVGSRTINGSIVVGQNSNPNSVISTTGSVTITGTKTAASGPLAWPAVIPPTGAVPISTVNGGSNSLSATGSSSVTIPAGTYSCDKIKFTGSGKLTFNGDVVLIVNGTTSLTGSTTIVVNGTLKIYCYGDSSFTGSGIINNTGLPKNCLIYGMPTCSSMTITGSSNSSLAAYAPDSNITVTGSSSINGSVVGKTLKYTGSSTFHYDESLGGGSGSGSSGFGVRAWEEDG